MATIDHAVPFHASPSTAVVSLPPAEDDPTAVHEAADRHDTPSRRSRPSEVPDGFGVGWMDHAVPFHASASVAASGPPLPAAVPPPTPVHAPRPPRPQAARRASAPGRTPPGPRVPDRAAPWMEAPTAVHAAAALHETPYRRLTIAPAGSGTVRTFQVLPFHVCASATMSSVLALSSFPTAMQAVAAVQDTPARKP
jgi:hypothetical protein